MMSSEDRPVALVTGAGRRIGNVVARTLADRGYRVALCANQSMTQAEETAREITEGDRDAIALRADLREETEVQGMIDDANAHFGRIDVLVNGAAVWLPKPLEEVTGEDVRLHFEVNTLGTFLCCQHVGLVMVGQKTGGVIVNIGDWAVARPYSDYSAYFTSKGAIPALTRSFAVELGQRNPQVRVNAILPGPVMLPEDIPEKEKQATIQATLVKREGRPENMAHAVLFFMENDYVTGACLPVDGGRTVYAPLGEHDKRS